MLKHLALALAVASVSLGADYLGGRQAEGTRTVGAERYEVVIFESAMTPDAARAAVEASFARARAAMDALSGGEGSALARLNAAQEGQAVPLDADTHAALTGGLAVAARTDGYFQITDGARKALWRAAREAGEPPTDAALESALPGARHDAILLSAEARSATVRRTGFRLDLGRLARARALDAIAEDLRAKGVTSAVIMAGGDLRFLGRANEAPRWRVGLDHPRRVGGYAAVLELPEGGAVATTTDAEGFFLHKGSRYAAVFDPRTGRAKQNDLASVTVRAKDAVTARALADAIFAMGPEKGFTLVEGMKEQGVEAVCLEEKRPEGIVISGSEGIAPHLKDIRL